LFTWDQLADSLFRADVAAKYQLGSATNRRKGRAAPGKEDGSTPSTGTVIAHSSQHPITSFKSTSSSFSSTLPMPFDVDSRWKMQACPVKAESRSAFPIGYEDVLSVIVKTHASSLNSCGERSLNEPLGRTLAKWKLNYN
jgi:hypothetical protein